jgi:fluoride exporter
MMLLVLAISGSIGAVARHAISGWVQQWGGWRFPMGTLLVNLTGAFVIGLVAGTQGPGDLLNTSMVGFLGGYTTFSTWVRESIGLASSDHRPLAWVNLGVSPTAGVLLAFLGYAIAG